MGIGLGVALSLAGAAASAAQLAGGLIKKKAAEKEASAAADKYRSIVNTDILNRYSGLQAKTKGLDIAQERVIQAGGQAVEAAREAGAEGVIGATTGIVQEVGEQSLDIAAEREQEEGRVAEMQAGEQAKIDAMQREQQLGLAGMELSGAQAAVQQGGMQAQAGMAGLASGLGAAGTEYMRSKPLYE